MELSKTKTFQRVFSGIILIMATLLAVYTIVSFFPNKMPAPGKGEEAWYTSSRFGMNLIEPVDSTVFNNITKEKALLAAFAAQQDSIESLINQKKAAIPIDATYTTDSVKLKTINDSAAGINAKLAQLNKQLPVQYSRETLIHLNTILLVLVACMGFLGNMIHVASSYTTYIGNGSFEKSWILWYCVKPFTAAGLAVIIYFVIRAGFMGSGSDASTVNLYGVLTFSALAGLYTDNATLKLKEVFDVIFRPKDDRSGKLDDAKIKVSSVAPSIIDVNNPNKILIKGENFDKKKITINVNDKAIEKPIISKDSIEFDFTADAADKLKKEFDLLIKDEGGKELYKTALKTTA